jgi:hypothetical protein
VKKQGIGGFLYLGFIGLALAILGGAFVLILGRGYLRAAETREWDRVPAVIVVSQVGERRLGRDVPEEYTHELVYEYEVGGRFFRGERLKRRENPFFKEEAKIAPEVERWKVGSRVEAFVNPENPEEALLEHETKAPGYSIWFPALFFVGGLGVFLRAMFKMLGKREE